MSCNPPDLPDSQQRSDALGQEITKLFGLITAATYDLLVRIRQFDQEKLWHLEGVCSCAYWLNWKCGIGFNAAREKVRFANALGELPKISEAFRLGKVSYSKVRAMTRVATLENEDYLLNIAKYGTAYHVESLVRGYRRAKQLNDVDSANKQHHARSLTYRYDDDGSLVIKGRLPAEVGAMLIKALDKAVERTVAETDNEKNEDKHETSTRGRPSFATRRADALMEMAESYLQQGPKSSSSADRYQVMVHVTAETSRRIGCDTSISRLLENAKGEPISIGRKSRVIPPPMRRALQARDKGCRFPDLGNDRISR